MSQRMGRIRGNGDDALKFKVATIRRFRSMAESFRGAPKMPIGAVDNPHFGEFTNPKAAPKTKTHQLLGLIQKIRQSSLNADFSNKLNMALHRRVRETKMKNSFLRRTVCFVSDK